MDFVAEKSFSVVDGVNFRWTSPKVLGSSDKGLLQTAIYYTSCRRIIGIAN